MNPLGKVPCVDLDCGQQTRERAAYSILVLSIKRDNAVLCATHL